MTFDQMGLRAELLQAIAGQAYHAPTPIQQQAIPVILSGQDLLAAAQTGTGKTASFALPVIEKLSQEVLLGQARKVRALILAPTRELASQIQESFQIYAAKLPLKSIALFGGVNIKPQITKLNRGVDIVIATPGRLLDHVNQSTIDLSQVEMLILDEADRMLDMGFIRDIQKILQHLPSHRQNLLFSATYSQPVRKLAKTLLQDAQQIQIAAENSTTDRVEQRAYRAEKPEKRALLVHLITTQAWDRVLIFTRTKHGAERLSKQLQKSGIDAASIHGDKSQNQRTRALTLFKQNQIQALVATDVAARGLDIDQLPYVVNFDLPSVAEDYVHRIGRTGRAGEKGKAISLVSKEEVTLLRQIEKLIDQRIDLETPLKETCTEEKRVLNKVEPQENRQERKRPAASNSKVRSSRGNKHNAKARKPMHKKPNAKQRASERLKKQAG